MFVGFARAEFDIVEKVVVCQEVNRLKEVRDLVRDVVCQELSSGNAISERAGCGEGQVPTFDMRSAFRGASRAPESAFGCLICGPAASLFCFVREIREGL